MGKGIMAFFSKALVFTALMLLMQKDTTTTVEHVEGVTFGLKKGLVSNRGHPENEVQASPRMYKYYDYWVSDFLEKFSSRMEKEFHYMRRNVKDGVAYNQYLAETKALKNAVTAYKELASSNAERNAVNPLSSASSTSNVAESLLSSPEFWILRGKRVRFWDLQDLYSITINEDYNYVGKPLYNKNHKSEILYHYDGKFESYDTCFIVWMVVPDNQGIQKYGPTWRLNRSDRESWKWEERRETLRRVVEMPANVFKSVRNIRSNGNSKHRFTRVPMASKKPLLGGAEYSQVLMSSDRSDLAEIDE